jgi:hypothetical protein
MDHRDSDGSDTDSSGQDHRGVDHRESATPARHRRRQRRLRLAVAAGVTALLVAGLVGAVHLLSDLVGPARAAQSPTPTPPPPPLLPGAPPLRSPSPAAPASVPALGYDVSHPQCHRTLPTDGGFGIVGVTGGRPLSSNSCVGDQVHWARAKPGHAVYMNTGYPGTSDPAAYGRRIVDDAIAREHAAGVGGTAMWWLDVETVNSWRGTVQQNATVLDAMAARLQELGVRVGIYSTPQMWVEIAGGWEPGLPVWYATGPGTQQTAAAACAGSFAGSATAIAQWGPAHGAIDHDLICPAYRDRAGEILALG